MKNRRDFLKGTSVLGGLSLVTGCYGAENVSAKVEEKPMKGFKENLLDCLGGPWPEGGDLKPQITKTEKKDGYRLEHLDYEVEEGDRVKAIMLIPDGVSASKPAPAVAVWHQHNGQYNLGKSEPAGLAGNPEHHTGVALVKLGYVVLCPDALCFETRQDPKKKLKGGKYERFEFLQYVVEGKSLAWKNILDMKKAVDYMASRPEVDTDRMGCYGHSMGSTHTWLVAPWEERLKVMVGNCCLPNYAAIERTQLLHCYSNFIPGLKQHGDLEDIVSLIAPRRVHVNLGEKDRGTPIPEAKASIEKIASVYKEAGAEKKFTHFIEKGADHVLTDKMWGLAKAAFAEL
ncbi:MAG: acetylxylan esterase [Lentisphaeraceae bacterium]|nr:acetylxylan esterase [Lentisphaeraceae bacterium]